MKKHFSGFLLFFLCFAILFGTQGFTIGKMICASGKVNISFTQPVDCCKKDNKPNDVIKNKCCDLKTASIKLSSFNLNLSKQIQQPVIILKESLVPAPLAVEHRDYVQPVSKAPPLLQRDILVFNSVFLI